MHYKKSSWDKEIDPAFNQIIKIYLEAFQKMQLPAREGYLALSLDGEDYKKIEMEGFPSVASLYEHDKMEDILFDTRIAFGNKVTEEEMKRIEKESKKKYGSFNLLLSITSSLEQPSKDYYLKSFTPFSSEESFKTSILNLDKKHKRKFL